MNKPEILGCEVLTPDGRGRVLSLHSKGVKVILNTIAFKQEMKGTQSGGEMHYFYTYEDVTVIKGRYCFNEGRLASQYESKYVNKCNHYLVDSGASVGLYNALVKEHDRISLSQGKEKEKRRLIALEDFILSDKEFLDITGIGKKGLAEYKSLLRENGITK